MNHIFLSLSFVFLLFNYSCGQDSKNRISLSREAAEYQLKEVLANNKLHNFFVKLNISYF